MRLHLLPEPELQFANGQHIDIRAGLTQFGAFDKDAGRVPNVIGLGLVGTTDTTDGVRDWIEKCRLGVASLEEEFRELRPDFPGVTEDVFGARLSISDRSTRTVTRHELKTALGDNDPLSAVAELFLAHAKDLAQQPETHVLIIAPPYEVFELGQRPAHNSEDSKKRRPRSKSRGKKSRAKKTSEPPPVERFRYRRNFHDVFKAKALALPIPCQMLRPDTYDLKPARGSSGEMRRNLQSGSTRAWNFHTALYYKAGGVPWRLVRSSDQLSTCYVGASFYRSLDGEQLMTSVAQVFNERGEGLILQGGSARVERRDRTPHLVAEDARSLLANGLAMYRREHKTVPARVVVHKSSYFDNAEIDGFRAAAEEQNISLLDLVSVRRGGTRLFLHSDMAVPRGTTLTFNDPAGVLCLKGTVSYFRLYPGHYVPRPVEFCRDDGETGPLELARELLLLSKLNFNNTQFDSGEPITIRAARRVGDILKNVEPGVEVNSRFRYFT